MPPVPAAYGLAAHLARGPRPARRAYPRHRGSGLGTPAFGGSQPVPAAGIDHQGLSVGASGRAAEGNPRASGQRAGPTGGDEAAAYSDRADRRTVAATAAPGRPRSTARPTVHLPNFR